MATLSVKQQVLNRLSATRSQQKTKRTGAKSEGLGSQQFMKLLVAQLKNQNPMKPTDTDKFSDQLAQFTQVESLGNIDKKVGRLLTRMASSGTDKKALDYVGMQVSGDVKTMNVQNGSVIPGFYDLKTAADVKIVIRDAKGNIVKTLSQGQQKKGAYLINWNGTGRDGKPLADGTYTYRVLANSGSGVKEVSTTITGKVDAVTYQNGKAYLVVGRVLVDPSSLISVSKVPAADAATKPEALVNYLGRTVSSDFPIVQVQSGMVSGKGLGFDLKSPQDVVIKIYDASGQAVRTMELSAKDTVAGSNTAKWDGCSASGTPVSDGLYYYQIQTRNGTVATPVSGKVTGIQTINGDYFLELGDSGRLVSLSKISSIR